MVLLKSGEDVHCELARQGFAWRLRRRASAAPEEFGRAGGRGRARAGWLARHEALTVRRRELAVSACSWSTEAGASELERRRERRERSGGAGEPGAQARRGLSVVHRSEARGRNQEGVDAVGDHVSKRRRPSWLERDMSAGRHQGRRKLLRADTRVGREARRNRDRGASQPGNAQARVRAGRAGRPQPQTGDQDPGAQGGRERPA